MSRVLVTGAASGLGLEAASQLARLGHEVILADRNVAGGESGAQRIRGEGGRAEFRELDLADLSRIRAFAADEVARGQRIDVLVNNAGLLPPKERTKTRDGFEVALGVAHLGHFALTGLLLPALRRSAAPRVVSVSSNSHPHGRIDFDDLAFDRNYVPSAAYMRSKLACLMFGRELQKRADALGLALTSVIAHPGFARTSIAVGWEHEGRRGLRDRLELLSYHLAMRFGSTAGEGARAIVHAATQPGLVPGGYYGPTGFMQVRGKPGPVKPAAHALDPATAARLWEVSERMTDVRYGHS